MNEAVVVCEVCGFFVPAKNADAVAEIAQHLRRKHPAYSEDVAPGAGGTLADWVVGAREALRRFTVRRQSVDACVAVASRLRTALALLSAVEEALRAADAHGGVLDTQDVRARWQRVLDGR